MKGLRKGPNPGPAAASTLEVDEEQAGQRLDNYLVRLLKGVPKSHVYRMLRTGEVRVNSRRVDASYRLLAGDRVRVPPVRTAAPAMRAHTRLPALSRHVLMEDEWIMALNKPAGVAVHGGSGISLGVIEQLRLERPELRFLELAHRLDRETSGILLLAKKRSALTALHAQLRAGHMHKRYLVLVKGEWGDERRDVRLPLHKYVTAAGERRVSVEEGGMPAHTLFILKQRYRSFALLQADLKTGRTHQIRVHLAHLGFPIAGDDKYGDFALNKSLAKQGLKRMFLHAAELVFDHPHTAARVHLSAPLPNDLADFLLGLMVLDENSTQGNAHRV